MKRLLVPVLCAAAAVTACSPRVRPTDVVARAGGHQLTVAHLTSLVQAIRPDTGRAAVVRPAVQTWIDLTLAGDAFALHPEFPDSAFLAEISAPRQASEVLAKLSATLAARRPALGPGEVDRLYASDSLRALRQILIRVASWQDLGKVSAAKARADSVLALKAAGQPFTDLARRFSADSGPNAGGVSLVAKPTVPAAARRALWAMEPGGTMLVRAPAGFVVIQRPLLKDVRTELTAQLMGAATARDDSAFADSVMRASAMRVEPAAVSELRRALDLRVRSADTAPLARFKGGALTVPRAVTWATAVEDQFQGGVASQSDSVLSRLIWWMARNELLTSVARSLRIDVGWSDLAGYRSALLALLAPAASQFRGVAGAEALTRKVDSLLTAAGRGERVPPIPGIVSIALRRREMPTIDERVVSGMIVRLGAPSQTQQPAAPTPFGQ